MYEDRDFSAIMDSMLSNVSDSVDKREGSVIYDALAPIAMELAQTYIDMDMILDEAFADTASYYYLIKRAAEKGIYPKEETYASCKMVVEPANTPISIGDRFNLRTLNYEVTSILNEAAGEYQLTCETAGVVGNQQLGPLLTIETKNDLNDMKSTELTEILIPGEEEEDVEDFRERYFASFGNEAFGGNKADYKEKINQIDGVGASKTVRMWERGYNPEKFIPVAEVDEWFKSQSEHTMDDVVYEWLKNVYTAAKDKLLTVGGTVRSYIISSEFKPPSARLVQTVQDAIDPDMTTGEGDGIAPIGHVVKVMGVQEKKIDVSIIAVYKTGYTFESVKSSICDMIDGYFNSLTETWSTEDNLIIRKSQIEASIAFDN